MNNKKIDLYFVDLDGTLLDAKKQNSHWVSKKNLEGINAARKEGKKIVVSTGRLLPTSKKFLKLVGGEYFITGNGAQIYDKNFKVIQEFTLQESDVMKIREFSEKNNLCLRFPEEYKGYGIRTGFQKFMAKKLGIKSSSGYNIKSDNIRYKVILWGKNKSTLKALSEELITKMPSLSVVTSFRGYTIEITSHKATKGTAAQFIARKLKVEKAYTAHVGDSMNDSPTRGKVGCVIAMKNSSRDFKRIAHYIGPHYKNGGVAKILSGQMKKMR